MGRAAVRVLSLLSLVATLAWLSTAGSRDRRPRSIVLVVVDMLRQDQVGCYGGPTPTPNMDRLASEGRRVDSAFASYHQTSMSMGSILTGLTPGLESPAPPRSLPWTGRSWCGMLRFAEDAGDRCIPDSVRTVAEVMRAGGYRTIAAVSNPLTFDPAGYSQGFDQWREVNVARFGRHGRRRGGAIAADVNLGVRQSLSTLSPEDRLFLYVHYMDVHDHALYDRSYGEGVAIVDAAIGKLLDALRAVGRLDDAVVVVTSDHGQSFGETHPLPGLGGHMGNPSYDEVLRVPLLVWGAPRLPHLPDLVRGEDLAEVLTGLAGRGLPRQRDLAPGEQYLSEMYVQTYRTGDWKALFPRDGRPPVLLDMRGDPRESRDVAAEHPEILAACRRRVDEIAARLRSPVEIAPEVKPDDQDRLRALGYLR